MTSRLTDRTLDNRDLPPVPEAGPPETVVSGILRAATVGCPTPRVLHYHHWVSAVERVAALAVECGGRELARAILLDALEGIDTL